MMRWGMGLVVSSVVAAVPAVAAATTPIGAGAEVESDVIVTAPPMPRRFVLELAPLSFILRRYGGGAEVLVCDHHAIVGSAYWFPTWTTKPDSFGNEFRGWGGEIGYRYYLGERGPRGFFAGASFLFGSFVGIPQIGERVDFQSYGGALDMGYQAILSGWLVLGIGLGIQYTAATESIPRQELPVSTFANSGIRPRFLASVGVAFGR
ncbi:hypothetical protein AKJ09_00571 [Labilithrix luteola]|uniref:DUF3575 domain-containing protein n=1 Tax=Labilithrix luteola TaxID=1391654 RepID=A0A0K1PK63_9BACT|nr:DUF3575 domain-containing protein [Labilithrix luteola]AKU93907.1 hypothetical protein AKJ09_00571 [Labilithrix luteola]